MLGPAADSEFILLMGHGRKTLQCASHQMVGPGILPYFTRFFNRLFKMTYYQSSYLRKRFCIFVSEERKNKVSFVKPKVYIGISPPPVLISLHDFPATLIIPGGKVLAGSFCISPQGLISRARIGLELKLVN